jgi:glycerol-3-phosphate dehydrogenase (NAD(P)+)
MVIESTAVAVLGAGSWGTALAILLARNGHRVMLWGHDPAHMARLAADRCNNEFLPGFAFPDRLSSCDALSTALMADDVLLVVPSFAFRAVLRDVRGAWRDGMRLAWATKGLETGTGKLLHEVVGEVMGDMPITVVSGPTFAREVAAGQPTAVTVASSDPEIADAFARHLGGETFRVYTGDDVVGVEIGGAVKNVLAIAAGIADGLKFGANARAALITRGLAEIMRLGIALGGHRETFMGLAGLGDLVLTCTDDQSRNRRLGLLLAVGRDVAAAQRDIGQVVEGVETAREVAQLAARTGVDMPIVTQVYNVLHQGLSPQAAVHALLSREQKSETL